MAVSKKTKDAFITRWIVIYSRGPYWYTAHFERRERARTEIRFLKRDCTDKNIDNIQLHRVVLWPRTTTRKTNARCNR